MSSRKVASRRTKVLAKLVTREKGPCVFCRDDVDDEIIYGKLYAIGDIKCHYFCVLLSCCLVQKGKDEEGLFGFLYPDILAEVERSKKHRCSYCGRDGASLGCSVSQCRKQFHLPCGRRRMAVSLFYGTYKSYCQNHAPKQIIAPNIMVNARIRMAKARKKEQHATLDRDGCSSDSNICEETVCVICYEEVAGYPTPETFWPPCCARDAWFHRTCLQRMALSAGMHYLKCPLCNDKDNFYEAVISQGYYVPDRDAAWELEQNAFAEIYEREAACDAIWCQCPRGRRHDGDGPWDIKLCILCGSSGIHLHCLTMDSESSGEDSSGSTGDSTNSTDDSPPGTVYSNRSTGESNRGPGGSASASGNFTEGSMVCGVHPEHYVCRVCRPAAPEDLETLANSIEAVIQAERAPAQAARPLMRARMSLRRTKAHAASSSSTSQDCIQIKTEKDEKDWNTVSSRQQLNLKPPRRPLVEATVLRNIDIKSPGKLLEHSIIEVTHQSEIAIDAKLLEKVRRNFKKPKPLCVKKRIVTDIIENFLNASTKESPKNKEPVKEWCSPKKLTEIKCENEEQENIPPSKSQYNSPLKTSKTTPKKLSSPISVDEETQDCCIVTPIKTECIDVDESSSSTFQLPPEFIADHSDDSLPIIDTPKLKTVDIKKDSSLEISENNEVVNINVVQMEQTSPNVDFIKQLNIKSPNKSKKCAFKFSPLDKETLESENVDIDVESFKNQYLNEVVRDFKCKFKHNHSEGVNTGKKLKTPIDFAIEANRKRKFTDMKKSGKRKKVSKNKYVECNVKCEPDTEIELSNNDSNLKLSLASKRRKKKRKKSTNLSIKDKNIKVKIRWRERQLKLKITDSQKRKKDLSSPKSLKQYVLKYNEGSSKDVLEKPARDVTPIKRKYVKLEKSPDNLKQTSIQSFFKLVPKNE
ncbi:uncharacterized protein LOC113513170 [Galleria mellonella]|uniref:Uncharacterized protein LOC113513170 n=1 Tax=Galleria mellonella TaxID=7137 RepID=A0ABM3MAX1_GALME|nr:uncharacterized protein LOC113513170 [Galleria mellonella]